MTLDTSTDHDAPHGLTSEDLAVGDVLRDRDGHGKTNGGDGLPDYTRKLKVTQSGLGDGWVLSPILENGETASGDAMNMSHDTINARIDSGRYELVDVRARKHVEAARMPVTRDDTQDAYIRFGDLPDGERSRNHADGHAEAGVSVYTARIDGVPPGSELPGVYIPVEARLIEFVSLFASRDAYLVTGREVGTGSDGEPVLRDVEVVCDLVLADPGDDDPASDVFGFVPASATE